MSPGICALVSPSPPAPSPASLALSSPIQPSPRCGSGYRRRSSVRTQRLPPSPAVLGRIHAAADRLLPHTDTGDRPYKCQHCGDQFARSDLLSRHINKCHASEKPPTTTAPNNRRKGTAAASRATTSKQACDQCVQSSLPCDGCNPCSKCVSRKCRCTYVKFHRQTAPSGPGHPPPNALPHHAHRGAYIPGSYPEDFLLAGPAAPSMNGLYMPADYALPPASSLYATAHAQAYADPRDPTLVLPRDALDASPEMLARYRAQAELLGRAGVLPNGALALNTTQPSVVQSLYAADHQPLGRYDLSSSQAQAWAHAGHGQSFQGDGHKTVDGFSTGAERPFPGGGGSTALPAHPPSHGAPFSTLPTSSQPGATAAGSYAGSGVPFPQHHLQHAGHASGADGHRRSEELSDDFGSDSAHSVPSSANSSSVHLPLVDHRGRPYSASPTAPYQQPNLGDGHGRKEEVGEGGFSSAFGLMSLDDPAVLAGLANDSAPFFSAINSFPHSAESSSGAHSTNSSSTSLTSASTSQSHETGHTSHSSMGLSLPTPTPELLASLKGNLLSAGGRDALDSKELRDFWKQYMRTPLTGPGSQTPLFPLQTPTGPGQQLGSAAGRPSPTRRHSRVNSLPSMKTPPIMGQDFSTFAPGKERQPEDGHRDDRHGYSHGYSSSVRTTLHGDAEDLKSYEQAVLARKAPTQLKLVPKRRGTMPAGTTAPHLGGFGPMQPPSIPSLSHATHMHPSTHMNGADIHYRDGQRPGSASSSLADAFGSSPAAGQLASSESPRESSVGTESSDGGTSGSTRPSFKRLASQTLGPENSKRALLGPAGWEDEDALEEDDEVDDDDGRWNSRRRYTVAGGVESGLRRFSLPTSAGAGIASGGSTLPPIKAQLSPSPVGVYPQ
ncbi:hypothetical protein EIP86_000688 [Pleurotus ostreatoroseus]|nr:hypothetical protein EIP86_000688 [Pleurotus ostreatoroseus]